MFLAKIYVTYKPSILDPQGEVIKSALQRMNFETVETVTQGKYFEVTMSNADEAAAYDEAVAYTEALLINPNTETYRIDLLKSVEA
ncbi:phosphoribosylformylglycinamidine synthase subunit PurS [Weissella confusa]|uniref:phosphoribosylformylglycinamidine synthase subunit PurS n=1 Tax=Weissella confusa TaxID=1583 RepID=UPI0021A55CE8|nr:phosphoribosylformylglycinamidine synthase subunit PurS [Weissella confusa]MCT2911754.1 phosphoribosylformylglycinamidine synthase subunit PurS [Weissella confusa]